ncbi:MAG: hypothetical protein HY646_06260 [Acidobacteria bacterium]|nr:hypothetical protein [Acidobacteriota bacterium]
MNPKRRANARHLVAIILATLSVLFLTGATGAASASDCSKTTVGLLPLTDLGSAAYKGFQGGLYPGGSKTRPAQHEASGLNLARAIQPLNAEGLPDPGGKYVLVSVGMSNTTQEFSTFKPMADADPAKNPKLVIVDGAQGGQSADRISDMTTTTAQQYWSTVDSRLRAAGVTPAQVQIAWIKQADPRPAGVFPNDALKLKNEWIGIAQILKNRFPNIRLAYNSNRIYAGYASSNLNPEPFAYQSGFAVKWLIEDQINGLAALQFDPARGEVRAPWLAWGPDLWADGLTPRSDGLTWECSDFADDGTHPGTQARQKVAQMLLNFFKTDATARIWFTNSVPQTAESLFYPAVWSSSSEKIHTGIAVTNLGSSGAMLTFSAFDSAGNMVRGEGIANPAAMPIERGAQRAWMDDQIFGTGIGAQSPAWIRLDSNTSQIASFYLLFNDSVSMLDGAKAARTSAAAFVLTEIDSLGFTEIRAANTNNVSANLTLELIGSNGSPKTPAIFRTIPANGELVESVESLFPAVSATANDYVRIRSDQSIVVAQVIGSINRRLAVLDGRGATAGSSTLYAPVYVSDGIWRSTLSIVNLDSTAGNAGIEFLTAEGTPIGPARSFPIDARGKLYLQDGTLSSVASPVSGKGYIRITSDGVKLAGSLVLSDREQRRFLAAAPLFDAPQSSMIFSHIAADSQYFTGIAILNPLAFDASVTIDVFDAAGNRIGSKTETLPSGYCRSRLIGEHVPELMGRALVSGYIRITSTAPIIGFGAFGTHDLETLAVILPQEAP